jgi:hypothetical protein
MREDVPPMTTVKLNSYFVEIGERSLMKEELAYKVCVCVLCALNRWWLLKWGRAAHDGGCGLCVPCCGSRGLRLRGVMWHSAATLLEATGGVLCHRSLIPADLPAKAALNQLQPLCVCYLPTPLCLCATPLANQVLQAGGVVSPISEYVQVYLNGALYGLYGLIEDVSEGEG